MADTRQAYVATNWVDKDATNDIHGTKLNAEKFNKIEQELLVLDNAQMSLLSTVDSINSLTGDQKTSLTSLTETVTVLQTALDTLTTEFNTLKSNFEAHVHDNETGDTTGSVVIPAAEETGGEA